MKRTNILVFGNRLVEKDNLALKIMPSLQEKFPRLEFKEFDSVEDLQKEGKNLKIMDVFQGLDKVKLLSFPPLSLSLLDTNRVLNMHDFDLAHNLKILQKMEMLSKVEILGIPQKTSEQEAIAQSQLILRKWVAQDIHGS